MTKPIIRIHNTQTNEIIDREMTDEEFTNYQIEEEKRQSKQLDETAKAEAKAGLLARLGLSEDEFKTLIS